MFVIKKVYCLLYKNTVWTIGVGRFRILGGAKVENFLGGQGGPNSQQAHDVVNQCQIITFFILEYDIIENSRIELRGIVLPVQVGGLLWGPKGMLAPPAPPPLPTPMWTHFPFLCIL